MATLVPSAISLRVSQFAIPATSGRLYPPGEQEAHTWIGSVASASSCISQFQKLLSDDETARASKFRFEKDRHEFVVSRGMLRTLLASYLGGSATQLRFTYSEHGKPRLDDAEKADHLTFNLSHSDGVILCAFARNREVGVDVEKMRDNFAVEEIAERFFSAGERNTLRTLAAEHRRQAFFYCWTRKEAYIKAKGEGLSLPLHQFDVSLSPAEPAALVSTRPDAAEASRWSLYDVEAPSGYAAALAVEIGPITNPALTSPDRSAPFKFS
jgi:4'-phosphopantetheinyl transferase